MTKIRTAIIRFFKWFFHYDWLAFALLASELVILFVCFRHVFPRFIEACRDFGLAFAEFFCDMLGVAFKFNISLPSPKMMELSDFVRPIRLPDLSLETLQRFGSLFCSKDVFIAYLQSLTPVVKNLSYIAMIFTPFLGFLYFLFSRQFEKETVEIARSRPLLFADWIGITIYKPTKDYFCEFAHFLRNHKLYRILYIVIAAFIFNLPVVALEIMAWYYHIIATFSFAGVQISLLNLLRDVIPGIQFVPVPVWIFIGIIVFDKIRKRRGYDVLEHHEAQNCGFIGSLPVVNFIWGTMGSKKTTLLTDMALSFDSYFRFKAYQFILDLDLLFPDFPWLAFERDLRAAMEISKGESGRVYNLFSARAFVRDYMIAAEAGKHDLYGYTGIIETDDGLEIITLSKALEEYAQLYLIYVVSSTLLISNYGIRVDSEKADIGNFPMWSFDFFHKDPRYSAANSRHSHILDFDCLKLGRKLISTNRETDGLEFGVICITEIAKERGNQNDLRKIDQDPRKPTQWTDRFNDTLKLARHFATVRHFPFIAFLVDDQRPESWGADARDLCQLICVQNCKDRKMAMPFHFLDDFLHDLLYSRFINRYGQYRYHRADNTLFMMTYKRFIAFIHHRYVVNHNVFDYYPAALQLEMGIQDGNKTTHPYYLSTKKIYSNRFETDAFAAFVHERVAHSSVGLDDIKSYATTRASIDEMLSCNSYFIRDITKVFLSNYRYGGVDNVS